MRVNHMMAMIMAAVAGLSGIAMFLKRNWPENNSEKTDNQ